MSFQEIEDVIETMFDESGVVCDFDWRDFTLPYGPKTTLTVPQTKALIKTVLKYVHSGRNMGGYIINSWTVLEAINHFQFRKLQAPETITLTVIKEGAEPVTVEATQEMAMGLYWGLQGKEETPSTATPVEVEATLEDNKDSTPATEDNKDSSSAVAVADNKDSSTVADNKDSSTVADNKVSSTPTISIRFPDGRPVKLHPPIAYYGVRHRLELNGKIYCYATDEFLTGIQLAYRLQDKVPPQQEI